MKTIRVSFTILFCFIFSVILAQGNEPAFQTKNGTYYFTHEKPIELQWGSIHFFHDSVTRHKTNGDTTVSYSVNSVVDPKYSTVEMSIYPNPFNKVIHIKYEKPGDLIVELIDMTGKYTMRKTLPGDDRSLDLSELITSTYILKVYDVNMQLLQTFKIEKVN